MYWPLQYNSCSYHLITLSPPSMLHSTQMRWGLILQVLDNLTKIEKHPVLTTKWPALGTVSNCRSHTKEEPFGSSDLSPTHTSMRKGTLNNEWQSNWGHQSRWCDSWVDAKLKINEQLHWSLPIHCNLDWQASHGFQGVHEGNGFGSRNEVGTKLLQFCDSNDLMICGTNFRKTLISLGDTSQIDYILIRQRDACKCVVFLGWWMYNLISDLRPGARRSQKRLWKLRDPANWQKIRDVLMEPTGKK